MELARTGLMMILQIVYNYFLFVFVDKNFEAKRSRKYRVLFAVLAHTVTILSYNFIKAPHIPGFINIIVLALCAWFYADISLLQGFVVSIIHFGVYYNIRGILVSATTFATAIDIADIFTTPLYHDILYSATCVVTILLLYSTRHVFLSKRDVKALLRNERQLEYLAIYQTVLLLFTMVVNDGRYEDFRVFWYVVVYAANNITVLFLLPLRLMNAADVSIMIEDLIYTSQIEDQLERQLSHYRTEKQREEEMIRFRHDYKNVISVLESLVDNKNYEDAKRLIASMKVDTEWMVTKDLHFSNNKIVDAILLDCYHMATNSGAQFEAQAYLPEHPSCSEFELVRVFTNLTRNAIEAIRNNPGKENYIKIYSVKDEVQNRVLITIENTYSGNVTVRNNRIMTQKSDAMLHGNGLIIVKDILNENNESCVVDYDDKTFKVRFSIRSRK